MKIINNPHKQWSVWGIGALGVFEVLRNAWPTLEGMMPDHIYDWGLFYLIIVVGVLRVVKQQVDSYRAK